MEIPNLIALFAVVVMFHEIRVNGIECGSVDVTRELVRGGGTVFRTEWPFIVALYQTSPTTEFICGGTLISMRHVLTAAHCIHRRHSSVRLLAEDVQVRLGAYNLTAKNEYGAVIRNVSEVFVSPDWNPDGDRYDADIAILALSDNVTFSNYIQPICVPANDDVIDGAIINVRGTVVGWGLAEADVHEEIPRQTVAKAINNSVCYRTDRSIIRYSSSRSFCARGIDGTPNKGDSGGGFFVVSESHWMQYGIVSALHTNATGHAVPNSFAIYTNVKSFKRWIVDTVTRSGGEVGELTMKVNLLCTYIAKTDSTRKYLCQLNNLEIRTERIKIASVSGVHAFAKNDDNVDSILFNSGSMFAIPDGLGSFFRNLKHIQIGNSQSIGLKHIWPSSLRNLENLETLMVLQSDIETLAEDCLWDLPNLRYALFAGSKLKTIDEKAFHKNEKLLRIFLSFSLLETLPRNIFRRNNLLRDVRLQGNFLKSLDEEIFKFATNLTYVDLSFNQMEALPKNLFRNNSLLESLKLNRNSLAAIDEQIFEKNEMLDSVSLSSNQLKFLPKNLFSNNLRLTFIDLSDNFLTTVDEQIFATNVGLITINLSSNELQFLPADLFQYNFRLAHLKLHKNSLKTIDELLFEKNTQLLDVDLSSNQLENLPLRLFEKNLIVERLVLNNNSLREIHEQFFATNVELVNVLVTNNFLTTIDENIFGQNIKLKTAFLSSNRLVSVPKNLFKNNSLLSSVFLDGNLLKTIDEQMFETNVQLVTLYLHSNRLESLPRNLLKNNLLLENIVLKNNSLTIIDEEIFRTNVKLTKVFFGHNKLEILPRNLFKNNPLLDVAVFNDNKLIVIDIDFTLLKKVYLISFRNNECINAVYSNKPERSFVNRFTNLTEFQSVINKNC